MVSNYIKYLTVFFCLAVLLFGAIGCGQNSDQGGTEKTLSGISVSPSSVVTTIESTVQFTAVGHYSDGSSAVITPNWIAPNGLGTISTSGLFTASGIGYGLIRATQSGITGSSSIVVNDKYTAPPTTPTGITSSNVTNTSATVTWDAVATAVGYVFSYGTDASATSLGTIEVAAPSINLASLSASTKYYVKVLAFNNYNNHRVMSSFSGISNFTTKASGDWSYETVDAAGDEGILSSMCVDKNGYTHIAYADYINMQMVRLRYATNKTGTWVTSQIDTSGPGLGRYPSIAVDNSGDIHISSPGSIEGLYYFTNEAGSWVKTQIPEYTYSSPYGQIYAILYPSIGMDNSGYAHICYQDYLAEKMHYATNQSGAWVTSEVDNSAKAGFENCLSMDNNGKVNDVYINGGLAGQIELAKEGQGGTWSITPIGGSNCEYPSIFMDSSNHAYVVYHDITSDEIRYINNKSGSFSAPVTVATNAGGGSGNSSPSIAVDSNGYAHIVFANEYGTPRLKYATNKSGTWQVTTLEAAGDVGYRPRIAIDSNDNLHICYYDSTNKILKYTVHYQ